MQEKEYIKLDGSVDAIIFRSEETGYTVLEMETEDDLVTVVGSMIDVEEGEELSVTGYYTAHPVYGTQFKAQLCERRLPATANAILKYLSSGAIKGIGPVLAKRIVARFGDETLEIMEKEPQKLSEISGISPKKAREIEAEYQRLFGIRSVMMFLSKFGLNPVMSVKIWHKWGMQSVELIKENPFVLCSWDIGMDFETADSIARSLGFEPDSHNRLCAGIVHTLRYNTNNGHTCLPQKKLCEKSALLTGMPQEDIDGIIDEMCEENELVGDTVNDVRYIYLPHLYAAETYVAGRIQLAQGEFFKAYADENQKKSDEEAIKVQIDLLEEEYGFKYAELQKKAIVSALTENLFILTGGPGTGKTTAINAMIELFCRRGDDVALCAPTGRAAKRMSQLTGREAKTIHRLLEVDFTDSDSAIKFKRNEKNPLKCDVIIIDEMSMVDICLFESLLKAMKMTCRLIMVGDADQLPSVGCGNVLKDLIDSGKIPTVQLNEIFRQAAQSLIVTNAHKIVSGQYPNLKQHDNDFFFLRRIDNPTAAQTVVDLCVSRLPSSYGYSSMWDIQVLAPSRKGELGTFELNRRLQQELNPKSPDKAEFTFNATVFREGDKVMQIRNNYDIEWKKDDDEHGMGIFNGDIGQIISIDKHAHTMKIQFDDRYSIYSFDMAQDIELSYACTVHKSQGSEFEAVIIPLMRPSNRLYYRNLLYTAVTRAKKLLILVGSEYAVHYMVDNVKKTRRYTNLSRFIVQALQTEDGGIYSENDNEL